MNVMKRVVVIMMAVLMMLGTMAVPASTTFASGSGNSISAGPQRWQSDSGGRSMTTYAVLQRAGPLAGQLDVSTNTHNAVLLTGFTGGVFILLRNADGAVIGVTDLHAFGVDGKWIGRYARTDFWQHHFDPQVAAATAQLEIIQQHAAKDLTDQVEYWKRIACENSKSLGYPLPINCE